MIKGKFSRRRFLKATGALAGAMMFDKYMPSRGLAAFAQGVPSVDPITILINDSPWFPGFAALTEMYTEATGNVINLDVTPFNGMFEKGRNAATSSESEYDVLAISEGFQQFFYAGGLLTPITDVDGEFDLDPQIISYGDMGRWNPELKTNTPDGTILGIPINGNIQLYYYRRDLFEEAGFEPPTTHAEMETIAEHFNNQPRMSGLAVRANPIWWEFGAYMHSYGAPYLSLGDDGAWTIGMEQPEALDAVNTFIRHGQTWAPPNYTEIGQSELLALMSSGRLAQAHFVGAAAPNFDKPDQSVVVGQVNATVVPGATADSRVTGSGAWCMSLPANIGQTRQEAGLTFLKWATQAEQQVAYALAGAIPVRQDTYEELSTHETLGWWTSAFAESTPFIRALPRIPETPEFRSSVNLRMAQAYAGEIPVDEAVALMGQETRAVLEGAGYPLS